MDRLAEYLGLSKYALYLMDYGAPVGYRLALLHPERVTGLIVQNGNAYEEGLREFWDPIKKYWANPEDPSAIAYMVDPKQTRWQYENGAALWRLGARRSSHLIPGRLDWAMTAKMPPSRVKVSVPLSQLTIGDASYILFTDLIVDQADLSTYINPEATLRNKGISTVGIRREEDGFHIEIHDDDLRFRPVEIPDATSFIPTVEISERIRPNSLDEINSQLDAARQVLQRRGADPAPPPVSATPATIPGVTMPAGRVRPPDRFLPELQIDETGYVEFTRFSVDENKTRTMFRRIKTP